MVTVVLILVDIHVVCCVTCGVLVVLVCVGHMYAQVNTGCNMDVLWNFLLSEKITELLYWNLP